ncbi:MAG: arginase [Leptolyngbya sp. PLA3]|nr:MAG: arginase [Cyanobacteria bacterium CYA]MCE7968202.1 arginase [Leptolyngbya sp. PL-A3]
MTTFDPNAAAAPDAGIFGLPCTRRDSRVILLGVPFDATTSYRPGTASGPEAIRAASMQVDLHDHRFGRIYERGIWMEDHPAHIAELSDRTRPLAQAIIDRGGSSADDTETLARIAAACEQVNAFVRRHTEQVLEAGKVPGMIGGEHALSLGAIEACAARFGDIGILQIDAHMDLRRAFEGFTYSHASIMHNVLARVRGVRRLVQVGIRDYCEQEQIAADQAGTRVHVSYWEDVADALSEGEPLRAIWQRVIDALPPQVYVSFDIDGLDPALCPHTGTPVPGGLSFAQASLLLAMLKDSGRTVIGFDLVEVAPGGPDEPEWDANVGARLLYRLCALA